MTDEIPIFKFAVCDGLDSKVFMPHRQHDTDTGWDVCAATDIKIGLFEHVLIPLGIRMFAPPGWWMELRPRSSSFAKKHMHCLYGVIDNTYEDQLYFSCQYIPPDKFKSTNICVDSSCLKISKGDRIGQLVPYRINDICVKNVSNEEFDMLCLERGGKRGTGGFGSSG